MGSVEKLHTLKPTPAGAISGTSGRMAGLKRGSKMEKKLTVTYGKAQRQPYSNGKTIQAVFVDGVNVGEIHKEVDNPTDCDRYVADCYILEGFAGADMRNDYFLVSDYDSARTTLADVKRVILDWATSNDN
jgi:hypothetical protein